MMKSKSTGQWRKITFLSAAAALLGCSGMADGDQADGERVDVVAQKLWTSTAAFWSNHTVPVCFTSTTWSDATLSTWRNNVRLWVTDGIARYANIYFSGFGQCPANPGAGYLKITRDNSFGNSNAFYNGFNSTENKIRFGTDSNAQNVVVHEFMHKLGFEHEFNRPFDSDNCSANQGVGGGTTTYTPYDRASILNSSYCHANATLSAYDIIGLHQVYGRKQRNTLVGQGGQCLNIAGGSSTPGTQLIAYPCQGVSNDTWTFQTTGLIQASVGGQSRCANIQGGAPGPSGTNLLSWTCSTADSNSLFHLTGVEWRAMGNMCMAATSTAAGAFIELQACGGARQAWDFFEGAARVRLTGTNLCAQVPGGSTTPGTQLQLANCAAVTSQTFAFSNGFINFGASRCLNVLGGTTASGSRLGIWDDCSSAYANEYFYTSGFVHGMGQCVDELGGNALVENNVGVYPCTAGAANQRWEYHF